MDRVDVALGARHGLWRWTCELVCQNQTGQQYTQAVGDAIQQVVPVMPLTGLKVLTQHVKNNRLRARINDALNPARRVVEPDQTPAKAKRTIH